MIDLQKAPFILYDGPMETRIEYGTDLKLDKEMSIFTLLDSEPGRQALTSLYKTDCDVAKKFDLPIILNAPTFRASREHCQRLGLSEINIVTKINMASIKFLQDIRTEYGDFAEKIFITGPIGPKYAGFTPELKFTIDEAEQYHSEQAQALAQAGADIMSIAAMPGSVEAIGCAKAVAKLGLPYSVGFVLTADGSLLDGRPAAEVIEEIDKTTRPKPEFYVIGCTHPSIAAQALANKHPAYQRIIGIKANGSNKPPKELLALDKPEADAPTVFADELIALGMQHQFKLYGGCCGTDETHLTALANKLSRG